MDYISLLELGLSIFQSVWAKLKGQKSLPAEVAASVEAALSALQAHYNDQVTQANLEAQRGV